MKSQEDSKTFRSSTSQDGVALNRNGEGRVSIRLRREMQSSGWDVLGVRGVLVMQVEKSKGQLGYTKLEFRRNVWA